MTSCGHRTLLLLNPDSKRLRCRHCHLSIKEEDLKVRFCPECYEVYGKKRFDFEELEQKSTIIAKYRCEECGITIECS